MLPDDLEFMRFPSECQSTCSACPKVKEENFHPDIRCCSYHPRVSNFLLGLALQDPETAPLIEKAITDGYATPEGLQSSPVELRRSLSFAASPERGEGEGIVCRFLDAKNRRCGIYNYRDSVCATFFCKHDQGDLGYETWRSLQSVAGQTESALAQWAMTQAGMDVGAYVARFDAMASDMPRLSVLTETSWPIDVRKALWGEWYGREAEFYRSCADHVRQGRDSLLTVLESWAIQSPRRYEQAFLDSLPPNLRAEMLNDGVISGEPMLISDLWYQFKLANRNLWQPPEP